MSLKKIQNMNEADRKTVVKIVKSATESLFDDQWGEILPPQISVVSNLSIRDEKSGLVYKLALVGGHEKEPQIIFIE